MGHTLLQLPAYLGLHLEEVAGPGVKASHHGELPLRGEVEALPGGLGGLRVEHLDVGHAGAAHGGDR